MGTNTERSLTSTLALGVRGAVKSQTAIRAATANKTVVKKPKTFCERTRVECMVALWILSKDF